MSDNGYLISAGTAKIIAQMKTIVLGKRQPIHVQPQGRPASELEYEGQFTTDASPPSDGWASPSSVMFQPYMVDSSSSADPLPMIVDPDIDPFKVWIRDPSLKIKACAYGRVRMINGYWTPTWVGTKSNCGSSSSVSADVPCGCVMAVTGVACIRGELVVSYALVRACCE